MSARENSSLQRERSGEQETQDPPRVASRPRPQLDLALSEGIWSPVPLSSLLPGKTQLFPPDRGPYLQQPRGSAAPTGSGVSGARAPVRPSRPWMRTEAPRGKCTVWLGWCAPSRALATRVPSASLRSSTRDSRAPLPAAPRRDAWGESGAGAGSRAGLPARSSLQGAWPGLGQRTPPLVPATYYGRRKTTGAGLPSASHPGGSPTSFTLAREEGFMQRARTRTAKLTPAPPGGRSAEAGPSPSPLPPGRQPGVSGTAGPGRAQQLLQDDTPAPAHRPPPPGRSSCNPRKSGASRRGRASCQATEFGVPSASPLSCSRDSRLFSCARGGRQGRHRCLFVPFAEGRRV